MPKVIYNSRFCAKLDFPDAIPGRLAWLLLEDTRMGALRALRHRRSIRKYRIHA